MSRVYMISDLHLGHTNIHEKWKTEFSSVEEHAEFAIDAWNSVVNKKDIVKVLGDLIIGIKNLDYLNKLKGTIHWTLGNHDPKITEAIMREYPNVRYVDGVRAYKHNVVLSHVPIHPNELLYRSWKYNVHGHIHHPEKDIDDTRYFNVNADIVGNVPLLFNDVFERLEADND